MGSTSTNKRLRAIYSGRVQGVGFRFTARTVAEEHGARGFVRNLWNGDVELVAEGTQGDLVDLLNEVRASRLRRNITNEHIEWLSATNEFDRFMIG